MGKLTNKQQAFVNEYLKCWNATKAAKAAGYAEGSAGVTGHRLLKDANVAEGIRARMEADAMAASEVLYHLAQIARGDMDDLLDANGNLDLEKARLLGKTNLIKRVKNRAVTTENSDISETETEGYDRLKALELLGKHHKLFTDKLDIDVDVTKLTDDELRKLAEG